MLRWHLLLLLVLRRDYIAYFYGRLFIVTENICGETVRSHVISCNTVDYLRRGLMLLLLAYDLILTRIISISISADGVVVVVIMRIKNDI